MGEATGYEEWANQLQGFAVRAVRAYLAAIDSMDDDNYVGPDEWAAWLGSLDKLRQHLEAGGESLSD